MFLFVGGAMGYISTISTKIEQIMCARGYSDQVKEDFFLAIAYDNKRSYFQLSGLSGSLILLVGFLASFPIGIIGYKTGKQVRKVHFLKKTS